MNLYNLHTDPRSLFLFKEADEYVLEVFFRKYRDEPEELRKREKAITESAPYAHLYAAHVLKCSATDINATLSANH